MKRNTSASQFHPSVLGDRETSPKNTISNNKASVCPKSTGFQLTGTFTLGLNQVSSARLSQWGGGGWRSQMSCRQNAGAAQGGRRRHTRFKANSRDPKGFLTARPPRAHFGVALPPHGAAGEPRVGRQRTTPTRTPIGRGQRTGRFHRAEWPTGTSDWGEGSRGAAGAETIPPATHAARNSIQPVS